jgi:hypothetical protein
MANSIENAEMQMELALKVCHEFSNPNFSAIAREFPLVNR